ncbi:hypothetical protein BFS79_08620 [Cutibacterium avidum]|nr:hypothetical protein BFS79_08620 [Cutibacterium avidum]
MLTWPAPEVEDPPIALDHRGGDVDRRPGRATGARRTRGRDALPVDHRWAARGRHLEQGTGTAAGTPVPPARGALGVDELARAALVSLTDCLLALQELEDRGMASYGADGRWSVRLRR